jgi:hypothetical protein
VIYSNTADTLYFISSATPAAVGQNYQVSDYGTQVTNATRIINYTTTGAIHYFNFLRLTSTGLLGLTGQGENILRFRASWLEEEVGSTAWFQGSGTVAVFSDNYITINTGVLLGQMFSLIAGCQFSIFGNYIRNLSGVQKSIWANVGAGCAMSCSIGNVYENFNKAVILSGAMTTSSAITGGGHNFLNNNIAISILTGGTYGNINRTIFTGNTTDLESLWQLGEVTYQPYASMSDIATWKNYTGGVRTKINRLGNLEGSGNSLTGITAYQVNAAERRDYPVRIESMTPPASPSMGDIWIDTN